MTIRRLELNVLVLDERVRARHTDALTIQLYTDDLAAGAVFPPVTVFHDGRVHILADGFMRYFAHKNIDSVMIECDVRIGDMKAARLHACTANLTHGLRATDYDRDNAILTMTECGLTIEQIAAQTGCTPAHAKQTIRDGRHELPIKGNTPVKPVTDLYVRQQASYVDMYIRWCADRKLPTAAESTFKIYVSHLRSEGKSLKTIYSYIAAAARHVRAGGVALAALNKMYPDIAAAGWKNKKP